MLTAVLMITLLALALVATALQHRRHAGATDPRICRGCGNSHPAHANFCARCGRAIGRQ